VLCTFLRFPQRHLRGSSTYFIQPCLPTSPFALPCLTLPCLHTRPRPCLHYPVLPSNITFCPTLSPHTPTPLPPLSCLAFQHHLLPYLVSTHAHALASTILSCLPTSPFALPCLHTRPRPCLHYPALPSDITFCPTLSNPTLPPYTSLLHTCRRALLMTVARAKARRKP